MSSGIDRRVQFYGTRRDACAARSGLSNPKRVYVRVHRLTGQRFLARNPDEPNLWWKERRVLCRDRRWRVVSRCEWPRSVAAA